MNFQSATHSSQGQPVMARWWILWPLISVAPHLLYLLQADFVAMLTIYVAWPATMGPLALLYVYLWQNLLSLNSLLGWLIALGLSGVWSGGMVLVGQKQRVLALALYLLGFAVTALLLWRVVIPPT